MNIITIIGARPQFIKAANLNREFNKQKNIKNFIVHTGQHFDNNMSDVFFKQMDIPKPDYNLNINGLNHGAMTGQMLEKIEEVLVFKKPDWVLVYGDTNSTLAGALAAKKLHIKVAHIEAGLRSFNLNMPEEINRILTDRISDLLFCPTNKAIENLKHEGFDNFNCKMIQNGDVMQDAALFYANRAQKPKDQLPERFVLCTIHRAENTDYPIRLKSIFDTLEEVSEQISMVMPVHPRTKAKLANLGYDFNHSKIVFIDPVGYLEMIWMLNQCEWVITDSGGLQKEAYFFKKQCITMREETEWIELVENGFNRLTGINRDRVLTAITDAKKSNISFDLDLYGNGTACSRIVKELQIYH